MGLFNNSPEHHTGEILGISEAGLLRTQRPSGQPADVVTYAAADFMAAILKVEHQIRNLTPLNDAQPIYLRYNPVKFQPIRFETTELYAFSKSVTTTRTTR